MNKLSISLLFIAALGAGLFIESNFDLIPEALAPEPQQTPKTPAWGEQFQLVEIKSPIDGAMQPAYFYPSTSSDPQPLIVSLHTWSNDYTQYDSINDLAYQKNYNYIHPNFRGQNNTKDACCSPLATSDIDAAIDYAVANANVDTTQIYMMGVSGGGYATLAMFMKSRHTIKKFSSWVPLVDLVRWHEETKVRKLKYADEILACTLSESGVLNREVAIAKSPIYWETPLEKLNNSQVEIYAGVYDGMLGNGVIPITHSINFYNKLLADLQVTDSSKYVSPAEKLALLEFRKPLADFGEIGGRKVVLVKQTNNIKLTLFEGGHEMLVDYAFEDLMK